MELDVQLTPWQTEVYASPVRFKVVAAGRRCGKSRLAAWLLIINALQSTKANSHVFYIAPTQGMSRDVMWGTLHELGHSVIKSSHVNNLQITLINGATISLKGADRPETLRGVSLKFCVLDEYAFMKPNVWGEIIRPALSDQEGGAMFITTPAGRNHMYDLYKYAEMSGDPDWDAWHFTSYDNPFLKKEEIDAAKKQLSSYQFRQEYLASFEARGSEIFKEEWLQFSKDKSGDGDYYVAIDLAGFNEGSSKKNKRLDNSCICVTKVLDDGHWFVEHMSVGRWTFEETARKIFQTVRDYRPVSLGIERGIAKQAVMSPLTDMMKRNNFFFRVEELTHGNQKKTDRIVFALQGRMEHGLITFKKAEWNSQLIDEISQFPDPLTHDDMIDALAYIDQLAKVAYAGNFEEYDDYDSLDTISGY